MLLQALSFDNPDRVLWEAAAAVPFTAFCAAAIHETGTSKNASGYRVMGYPGAAPQGYRRYSYRRKLARERTKKGYLPLAMAERVDVCIAGSGFGGSITALRLAELYRAAGADPKAILVLERGPRFKHTDFKQSMDIGHLSNIYSLIQSTQGTGHRSSSRTVSAAARTSTSPRSCARRARRSSAATATPTTAPSGGCGRSEISRATLNPYYRRAELALRVQPADAGTRCRSRAACGRPRSTRPATRATASRSRSTSSAA